MSKDVEVDETLAIMLNMTLCNDSICGRMQKNKGGAGNSFRLPLGERALWDPGRPDHECDCPGPPPQFYLPPPPRPSSLGDSDCSENSLTHLEICDSMPVIDAEYHYTPAIPSLALILAIAVVVVVLLIFGTFLVILKKRKARNLFPRKSSPQNLCDAASANGVIYEDLANVRSRRLPLQCPPGQTTLPPIEMIDVSSQSDHGMFSPVFICPASPVLKSYNSQELFNPVYEELSNESGDRGETDSEEMPRDEVSEDEFAEDELSLGGEREIPLEIRKDHSPGGFVGSYVCGDADPSDADDRSKFLENFEKDLNLPSSDRRGKVKRMSRTSHFRGPTKEPKSPDRKSAWKNKGPSTLPAPSADCDEFRDGSLLDKILHVYPDVTSVGLQYSRRSPAVKRSQIRSLGGNHDKYDDAHARRSKPDIFSTIGGMQGCGKNQSQDSSLGSDSGYSNNTSGGKSSAARRDYAAPQSNELVLS